MQSITHIIVTSVNITYPIKSVSKLNHTIMFHHDMFYKYLKNANPLPTFPIDNITHKV